MKFVIIAAVLLGLAVYMRFLVRRRQRRIAARQQGAGGHSPVPETAAGAAATYAAQDYLSQDYGTFHAPGTIGLDEVDSIRPEIDSGALASARSSVSSSVPDGVLADALLDSTPDQLRNMFAAVPADVMANAIGSRDDVQRKPLAAEDLAQLQGVSDSVDDLEIWGFVDKN